MNYNIEINHLKRKKDSKILCTFSIIINDCIEIHNLKLYYSEKSNNHCIFFPSFYYKDKNCPYIKVSSSLHEKVLQKILEEYKKPEIIL